MPQKAHLNITAGIVLKEKGKKRNDVYHTNLSEYMQGDLFANDNVIFYIILCSFRSERNVRE